MKVEYTGRQIEITPAIKRFTEDHLRKIRKILGEMIEVHVILTVEKYRHIAEINLKSRTFKINGIEETHDMYTSINAVLEKIERQALKHKGKKIAKKRKPGSGLPAVISSFAVEPTRGNSETPRVIKSRSFAAKPMTVEEAVQEVTSSRSEFIVFRNAESERVSVVYRRKDGNFGLIEP
ncbi:MAG: ribosome-associated translation inhibitor RaiA [Acidobacteria bacterium]|nr:MAG: ribosome-associated translation inhibitor RaiA [Acidobacteriota bacterium]